MRITKFILIAASFVLTVLFICGIGILYSFNNDHGKNFGDISDNIGQMGMDSTATEDGENSIWDESGDSIFDSGQGRKDVVNFLVLGLDNDETRADVILLLNFDTGSKNLNILSIARDTRVRVKGEYCKINAVYSKGIRLMKNKITEITGLDIDYYAVMNLKGFRETIDLLGGVEFDVPFRMKYDDPTQDLHINLLKGRQILDGDKAEQLIRYRKGNRKGQGYSEGDIGRIEIQQEFLKELIRQKVNLKYIGKIDEMFGILKKYLKTDIGIDEVVKYAGSIAGLQKDNTGFFTLPGDSVRKDNKWYYVYNKKKTQKMIEENFYK